VTYTPIKGDDFARIMLTPIAPSELFAMLAAGAPADLTLGLGVQSINRLVRAARPDAMPCDRRAPATVPPECGDHGNAGGRGRAGRLARRERLRQQRAASYLRLG
jgi:hypothetical protein